MVRQRTATTPILGAPSHKPLWQELYDHTAAPVVDWALDNKLASTVTAVAIAGAITAGVFLSTGGIARNVNRTQSTPAAGQISSSQSGQTASEIYYSQVRSAIMQDVPDFANPAYKSALDYTAQRMVDLKTIRDQAKNRGVDYGTTFEQIRQPLAKWVQANIDWDKKGERLIPLSEANDFIPESLFYQDVTTDRNAAMDGSVVQTLRHNTDWIVQEHGTSWHDVNDPKIVKEASEYLEWLAQPGVLYEGVGASFPPYVKAIREKGTFADKGNWTLYVKGRKNAPDEIRKYVGLGYILSAGGDAQIEIWGFGNYTDKSGKIRSGDQHGDLAVAMSSQLRQYIESDPSTFGHLLDTKYLGILPSREGVEAQGNMGTGSVVKFIAMWRELPSKRLGTPNRTFIYGDEATAIANGHN